MLDTDGTEVAAAWEFALSDNTNAALWLTGIILEYIPISYFESLREWATAYVTSKLADEYLYEGNADTLRRVWDSAGLRFRILSEYVVVSFEWPLVDIDDESIIFGMRVFDLDDVLSAYTGRDPSELNDWIDEYAVDIAEYLDLPPEADEEDDD